MPHLVQDRGQEIDAPRRRAPGIGVAARAGHVRKLGVILRGRTDEPTVAAGIGIHADALAACLT